MPTISVFDSVAALEALGLDRFAPAIFSRIDAPLIGLTNYDQRFEFFNEKKSLGLSSRLLTAGWEPSLCILGVFVATIVIRTSPDGINFIPVLTCTAPALYGRNDLKFPSYAMQLEITAFTSGAVSALFYAERRHR